MSEEVKNTLRVMYDTLGDIEVHGRKNMDMLLGCMIALEKILKSEEE